MVDVLVEIIGGDEMGLLFIDATLVGGIANIAGDVLVCEERPMPSDRRKPYPSAVPSET